MSGNWEVTDIPSPGQNGSDEEIHESGKEASSSFLLENQRK